MADRQMKQMDHLLGTVQNTTYGQTSPISAGASRCKTFTDSQYRLARALDAFAHLLGDAAALISDTLEALWKQAATYLCFGCQLNHRLPEVELRVTAAHRVLFTRHNDKTTE